MLNAIKGSIRQNSLESTSLPNMATFSSSRERKFRTDILIDEHEKLIRNRQALLLDQLDDANLVDDTHFDLILESKRKLDILFIKHQVITFDYNLSVSSISLFCFCFNK
jgi:hypothetical protein